MTFQIFINIFVLIISFLITFHTKFMITFQINLLYETALTIAVKNEHLDIVKFLSEIPEIDINLPFVFILLLLYLKKYFNTINLLFLNSIN